MRALLIKLWRSFLQKSDIKLFLGIWFFACFLWLITVLGRENNIHIKQQVRFTHSSPVVVLNHPKTVDFDLHIEGKGWNLMRAYWFSRREILDFDLSKQSNSLQWNLVNDNTIVQTFTQMTTRVISVFPTQIRLDIDSLMQKKIPLVVNTNFTAPKGYIINEIELVPDSVVVVGSPKDFEKLEFLNVGNPDSNVLVNATSFQFKLTLPANMKLLFDQEVRLSPKLLQVKEWQETAVPEIKNLPKNLQVSLIPSKIRVKVYSKNSEHPPTFSLYVDYKQMPIAIGKVEVKALSTDSNVVGFQLVPGFVDFIIKR